MTSITLIAALFSLIITIGVLWINPRRFSNQVFSFITMIESLWLFCVYQAMRVADHRPYDFIYKFDFWIRTNAAVIAFLPAALWLLKNAIISGHFSWTSARTAIPLLFIAVVTVFICYTDYFIFIDTTSFLQRGPAYYFYSILAFSVYAAFLIRIFMQIHNHSGIRRVELQFLALNVGGSAFLLAGLNAIGNYFEIPLLKSIGVLLLFSTSTLTAWALLFHRIFNARELLLEFGQRMSFIIVLTTGIYSFWHFSTYFLTDNIALIVSVGIICPMALWFDRMSREWFERNSKKKLGDLRHATLEVAARELDVDLLTTQLERLLAHKCHVMEVILLVESGNAYFGRALSIPREYSGIRVAIELGWATPESLNRRRPSAGIQELRAFLRDNTIALLLSVPQGNPSPSMLVAFKNRYDELPFTYPEIRRLQNVVELMDNCLTRSRRAASLALEAKIDYLAVASRGLAHDLNNLITPVATFLLHTDNHFPTGSPASEVHATARRSVWIMSEYIRETLFFCEQLRPRFETVEISSLFQRVCEITNSRAARRGVSVIAKSDFELTIVADDVLIKRLLSNIINNAIDASYSGNIVRVTLAERTDNFIRIEVSDDGCGIPRENLSRIFDPYFTTKSFGDEMRGFGLGLTISHKIVILHNGKLSVQSEVGRGTTVSVELPITQPTIH